MAGDFRKALQEIDAVRNTVLLLFVFLDTAFVFLATYFVLILFNFYPILAFIPALFYFVTHAYKQVSAKTLKDIEEKYPDLREKLRTAADTVNQENFMILRLRTEVLGLIKTIAMSSLVNTKKIAITLGKILVVAFLIVGASAYNVQIIDMQDILQNTDLFGSLRDRLLKGHVPDSLLDSDIKNINDNTGLNDLNNPRRLRQLLPDEQLVGGLPEDIFKGSDKSFEESLSKKKRIYIRNYFSKVRHLE